MAEKPCHKLIEMIREIAKDCPAVRMHDNWGRLCDMERYLVVDEDACKACPTPEAENSS